MSDIQFPRTQIEGVTMPRMIMGTNRMWIPLTVQLRTR